MNEELEQIKAALRLMLELDEKATPWPWRVIGEHQTEVLALEETAESIVVVDTRFFDRQTNKCETEDATFIAHARTYAPLQALALLTTIEALEYISSQRLEKEWRSANALQSICREWRQNLTHRNLTLTQ